MTAGYRIAIVIDKTSPEILIRFENDPYYTLRCDICGSYNFTIVQEGFALKSNVQIAAVRCANCGDVLMFHHYGMDETVESH